VSSGRKKISKLGPIIRNRLYLLYNYNINPNQKGIKMFTFKERNQIVGNVIRFINSPPQCPCCEPSKNDHLLMRIGETDIPLKNILEVKADHINGCIGVGFVDETTKQNVIHYVPEQCFEEWH